MLRRTPIRQAQHHTTSTYHRRVVRHYVQSQTIARKRYATSQLDRYNTRRRSRTTREMCKAMSSHLRSEADTESTLGSLPNICSPSSGRTPCTTLKHNTDVKRAILPTTLTGSPGQDTLLPLSAVSPKAQQIKARITMGRSRTLLIT